MITFKAKTTAGEIINSALESFIFPAGEAHIKEKEHREIEPIEIAIIQPSSESIHTDLFALAMWNDYFKSLGSNAPKRVLVMPYFPGARADRGTPFGLYVYVEFINSMNLDQVIIFDPHSPETVRLLSEGTHTVTAVYSDELFDQPHMRAIINGYTGIIAPDKGAVLRASAVAKLANIPVFTATKHRDEANGRLSNFSIEGLDPDGFYLIIDDICDGGGTFLGLAKASGLHQTQLDLYVSHGVFSKNALENLSEVFSYIFTTNSYNPRRELVVPYPSNPLDYNTFRRFDVIRLLLSRI